MMTSNSFSSQGKNLSSSSLGVERSESENKMCCPLETGNHFPTEKPFQMNQEVIYALFFITLRDDSLMKKYSLRPFSPGVA
jgi:hypothetical protein